MQRVVAVVAHQDSCYDDLSMDGAAELSLVAAHGQLFFLWVDISSKNPLRVSVAGHSAPKTRTFEDRRPVRGLVPAGMPKFQILGSGTALDEDTDAAVDMSGSRPGSPPSC